MDIVYTLDNFVTMETLDIFDTLEILDTLDTLEIFKTMDKDMNGHIELDELKRAVRKIPDFQKIKNNTERPINFIILDCQSVN